MQVMKFNRFVTSACSVPKYSDCQSVDLFEISFDQSIFRRTFDTELLTINKSTTFLQICCDFCDFIPNFPYLVLFELF